MHRIGKLYFPKCVILLCWITFKPRGVGMCVCMCMCVHTHFTLMHVHTHTPKTLMRTIPPPSKIGSPFLFQRFLWGSSACLYVKALHLTWFDTAKTWMAKMFLVRRLFFPNRLCSSSWYWVWASAHAKCTASHSRQWGGDDPLLEETFQSQIATLTQRAHPTFYFLCWWQILIKCNIKN